VGLRWLLQLRYSLLQKGTQVPDFFITHLMRNPVRLELYIRARCLQRSARGLPNVHRHERVLYSMRHEHRYASARGGDSHLRLVHW